MPPLPEAHAIAVLLFTGVALFLFTREKIALETSSLTVLAVLAAGFELFPLHQGDTHLDAGIFFHGFGHEALVAVCALMIAGQGIVRTGALEPVGRGLAKMWRISPALSLLLTLLIGGILSAFVNNTPIVVLLLPILISVSLRTGKSASGVLMPMGFATLVGGMATTIGTSTNLLVVAVAASLGMRQFGMFDFALPAALAGVVGILYLWLIAPRMLGEREAPLQNTSPRLFTARLNVAEGSFCDGKPLAEILKNAGGMRVNRIRRGVDTQVMPLPDATIRAGDQLVVRDTAQSLKEYEQTLDAALYVGDNKVDEEHPLSADDQQLAEIAVFVGSSLVGSSLRGARFSDRFQVVALALHRSGRPFASPGQDLADIVLQVGDVLLVQGPREQIAQLRHQAELLVLDATEDLPHTKRAWLALGIMIGIVGCAALGIMPIAISAVCGALLLILTGCLSWKDAANALSTQVILIVVASLALGTALLATGGTDYLTALFLAVTQGASPRVVLSALMLLMAVMTNIVSNNAAAVIGTPIAFGIATELGLPPEPFVLAVLFGANMSYATPMAYKTNLLVMNAGGYTFGDFVRIGVPLTILMWLVLSWILPTMYGF
ncbi:MAG: di/tricarboxylate transporter [Gammaproteobacteria bacterium]|jgi:di/tricarboxylate transporter